MYIYIFILNEKYISKARKIVCYNLTLTDLVLILTKFNSHHPLRTSFFQNLSNVVPLGSSLLKNKNPG